MEFINTLVGVNWQDNNFLTFGQIITRTMIAFTAALLFVRLGQIRFLKKSAAFDAIMYFMLGALMVDAISTNNNFFAIILGGFVIIFLHWLFSFITYFSSSFGYYLKGREYQLIKSGQIQWDEMRKTKVTQHDLEIALRLKLNTDSFNKVKEAYLERNGDISFITTG